MSSGPAEEAKEVVVDGEEQEGGGTGSNEGAGMAREEGEQPTMPRRRDRRGSALRKESTRPSYLTRLMEEQDTRQDIIAKSLRAGSVRFRKERGGAAADDDKELAQGEITGARGISAIEEAEEVELQAYDEGKTAAVEVDPDMKVMSSKVEEISSLLSSYGLDITSASHRNVPIETRVDNFTYAVPFDENVAKIMTVFNSSPLYRVVRLAKRVVAGQSVCAKPSETKAKTVLDRIDLIIEPGKAYLLLGPPGSGRSTLLKAIAGLLRPAKGSSTVGSISYNGRTLEVRAADRVFRESPARKRYFIKQPRRSLLPNPIVFLPGQGRVPHRERVRVH
jgi:ABC-type glutathione transport system ATPase component